MFNTIQSKNSIFECLIFQNRTYSNKTFSYSKKHKTKVQQKIKPKIKKHKQKLKLKSKI